jgi:hypothetical protein
VKLHIIENENLQHFLTVPFTTVVFEWGRIFLQNVGIRPQKDTVFQTRISLSEKSPLRKLEYVCFPLHHCYANMQIEHPSRGISWKSNQLIRWKHNPVNEWSSDSERLIWFVNVRVSTWSNESDQLIRWHKDRMREWQGESDRLKTWENDRVSELMIRRESEGLIRWENNRITEVIIAQAWPTDQVGKRSNEWMIRWKWVTYQVGEWTSRRASEFLSSERGIVIRNVGRVTVSTSESVWWNVWITNLHSTPTE